MRIINQSYEICGSHGYDLEGIYKDIEKAARISYKSEDKITKDSAYKMVSRLIEMKHYSPLEFGTVYLTVPIEGNEKMIDFYKNNKFSRVSCSEDTTYITTNYRVLIENNRVKDLDFLSKPTEHHMKRMTVKFITNRAVSHELVRHRSMSFMQESQRYVSYDKGKFGNEITFIKPAWRQSIEEMELFNDTLRTIESTYMTLRKRGLKPQQARQILPNATKTEIYVCGYEDDWEHFFDLRDKLTVDPQMYDLIHELHEETIRTTREAENA